MDISNLIGGILMNNNQMTVYNTDSGEIKLNANIVRQQLVTGNSPVTDKEIYNFISLCKYRKLNPFLNEAYLIKYGNEAQIITSKDVFIKRLNKNPKYQGQETGVIVEDNQTHEIITRKGTFYRKKNETLIGAYTKLFIKDWVVPFEWSINLDEYIKKLKNGQIQSNWKNMPAIMLTKCCMVSSIRNAFPEDFSGMYIDDELGIEKPNKDIINDDDILNTENVYVSKEYITDDDVKDLEELSKTNIPDYDYTKLMAFVLEKVSKQYGYQEPYNWNSIDRKHFETIKELIEIYRKKKEKAYNNKISTDLTEPEKTEPPKIEDRPETEEVWNEENEKRDN